MLVTALRPDARTPGNIVVELDRQRFASLPAGVVDELGLHEQEEIGRSLAARLRHVADVEASRQVALRMLAAHPRAVNELLWRLRQRGHNPSAAAEAVGRLEAVGLLDDREFVRHFVRVRSPKGHGRSRLIRDLLAKGVERRLAERTVDETLDAEGLDADAQVRAIAERRAAQLAGVPPEALERRLLGYLARRGFRGSTVREVVRELVATRSPDREV
jgi:regulatory protein